jgi:streptogramin lyase
MLASDADQIWVTDPTHSTVSRIEPKQLQLVDTVPIPTRVGNRRVTLNGVAVGEGAVWITGGAVRVIAHGPYRHGRPAYFEGRPLVGYVWRVDPATRRVVARIRFPRPPDTIAAGGGSVWVTGGGEPTVWRIDPVTNRVNGRTRFAPPGTGFVDASGIAFGYGSLWVGDPDGGLVRRLDPHTLRTLEVIPVGPDPQQIAVGFGSVWVTHWDVRPYDPPPARPTK